MSHVKRVDWVPGSDRLRGECHCGAHTDADDPNLLWGWLDGHPEHPAIEHAEPPLELPPPHLVIRRRA